MGSEVTTSGLGSVAGGALETVEQIFSNLSQKIEGIMMTPTANKEKETTNQAAVSPAKPSEREWLEQRMKGFKISAWA